MNRLLQTSPHYDFVGPVRTVMDDILDREADCILADNEDTSELIALAVSYTHARAPTSYSPYALKADETGKVLLELFRNRDWIAFGERLDKAVHALAIDEARRRVEGALS